MPPSTSGFARLTDQKCEMAGDITDKKTRGSLPRRFRHAVWIVAVNLVLSLVLVEIVLRAQQAFGPFYDLDVKDDAALFGLSDELNHTHMPPVTEWDADQIRRMRVPNSAQCTPKLLFMGGSFLQGLGIDDTVPVHVRDYFRDVLHRDICVFNAGASSYSPSVWVPQARKLIPRVKPDVVIIDNDELNLWDEYYRYRHLVVRDQSGSIVAVRRTPLADEFLKGLAAASRKPLYVQRALAKLYFTRVVYPQLSEEYRRNMEPDGYWISRLPAAEAKQKYDAVIRYYEGSLQDLAQTVAQLMGGPRRLIYIYHPHLENVRTKGEVFNNVASDALREVAARNNVRYYDATDDLKMQFGATPERYYIPNDMHLNALGLRAYGLAVAKYLTTAIPSD
jgi:hypothetical protein